MSAKPLALNATRAQDTVEKQCEIQREQDRRHAVPLRAFESPGYERSNKLRGMAARITVVVLPVGSMGAI